MQQLLENKDFESLLDFSQRQDGTRLVISKQTIKKGDSILKIPKYLQLSSDFDYDFLESEKSTLSNDEKYQYGISTFKLMIYVLEILNSESETEKKYYIKSLPKAFNLPIEWEQGKLDLIQGTDLYKITLEKKRWLSDATEIAARLKNDCTWITFENMKWAYSIISSRSFPKGPGEVCLWPILDYLDHDAKSKIEWIITDFEIRFVAMEDIQKGVVVYNNYGPKGNENLLNNYGFVIKDNPYDYVKITLNSGNDPLYKDKKEFLETGKFKDSWLLFLEDVGLPDGMIRQCRILLCNDFEWARLDKNLVENIQEISIRNEVATFQSMIQLLGSKLKPYLESLQKMTASENHIHLLIYTENHARILKHHLQLCEHHLNSVITFAEFFCLDSLDLDQIFLNACQSIEEMDEDTILCLALIHEKERNSIFSTRLSNLKFVIFNDEEEEDHFLNLVLPHFAFSDYINLESLKWASAILSIHGGYGLDGSFGVWLPHSP